MNKIKISKNFSLHEFECNDGSHLVKVDERLIEKLQKLRDRLGVPLYINSGYRTPEYNKKIGGSSKSQHVLGKAVDINIRNIPLPIETIKDLAVAIGFTGIGLYDVFIHLDVRDNPHPRGYSFWDLRTKKEKPKIEWLFNGQNSRYGIVGDMIIIETDPSNLYAAHVKKNIHALGVFGINGPVFNMNDESSSAIWMLLVNDNKPVGPNSYTNSIKGYKRGTIVYYKDGELAYEKINNINEFNKPVEWAIGGFTLDKLDKNEHIPQDMLRKTNHTAVGIKNNKVYLIVIKNATIDEFREQVQAIKLENVIFVDGGDSTQMNYKGKGIYSKRNPRSGLFLKKL